MMFFLLCGEESQAILAKGVYTASLNHCFLYNYSTAMKRQQ